MIILKDLKLLVAQGTPLEKVVLNGINLKIDAGEFITVIGTNGAGKSTLLNALAGEYIPSEGSIEIDGENITHFPTFRRSHLVARVFQSPLEGTCGELTVVENMALAQKRGLGRSLPRAVTRDFRRMAEEILLGFKLGLENRLDTPMGQLSGGQRQALSLMMATLSPLKVLLLDEHTSALDPKTAEKVLELTAQVVKTKKLTTLMVTHSLTQAIGLGDRTVLLHEGKVAGDFSGAQRSSLTAYDLMKLYKD